MCFSKFQKIIYSSEYSLNKGVESVYGESLIIFEDHGCKSNRIKKYLYDYENFRKKNFLLTLEV